MHKIFDLKEMDIEQLRSLASELELKGFKKMEKDDLVYAILDEEARKNAMNAPDKPERPRRGRPRKSDKPAPEQPKQQESKEEIKTAEVPIQQQETEAGFVAAKQEQKPQPKKRGRKPKQNVEQAPAPAPEVVEEKKKPKPQPKPQPKPVVRDTVYLPAPVVPQDTVKPVVRDTTAKSNKVTIAWGYVCTLNNSHCK